MVWKQPVLPMEGADLELQLQEAVKHIKMEAWYRQ